MGPPKFGAPGNCPICPPPPPLKPALGMSPPPPILKSRGTSYVLVPPHFYHNIYLYWLVPPIYKIVPEPLIAVHCICSKVGGDS